jgi:2-methylisocitrate lyase-like PEP mutase family enzyme
MVGQCHLGGRESAHSPKRLQAEDCGKMMLPSLYVQAVVLHRRRRRNRMPPSGAEPFDGVAILDLARNPFEVVEDIVEPHIPQAVKQGPRVIKHHPRLPAFIQKLWNELAHALVAPVEDRCVVIIADILVVHHVFEIADHGGGTKVRATGRNHRAVKDCEKAGAAGLFIEDQTYPKRCGHMAGKNVISVEEYLPKLKAALWAKKDPDFVITARTDAFAVYGIEEAVRRAKIYAHTGADMVFVEAVHSVEDMKKVNQTLAETNTPCMANVIEGGQTSLLSAKELQELGYSAVAYPCASVYVTVKALQDWARHLKEHGGTKDYLDHMLIFDQYFEFIGARAIREREKQFL